MTARSRSLSTPALALVAALLSTGMVGAAEGTTVWKCVEDATLYLHRPQPVATAGDMAGHMDEEPPDEVAPHLHPDFRYQYPLDSRLVLPGSWMSTVDQASVCAVRGTLYAAAPTSTSVATTRLSISIFQDGTSLLNPPMPTVPQSAAPVAIDFNLESPGNAKRGGVDMFVTSVSGAVPSPVILAYDSVDYPSHVVTSVWIACEQDDPDPDPRCHED